MTGAPRFSIAVPLYNEADCVTRSAGEIVDALEAAFPGDYELILVINGSTDRTGELCEALARRHAAIRLVRLARNQGYGGGILAGLDVARGTYCGFMCGDGQVAADILVMVMRRIALGDEDFVKTRRISRGDGWQRRAQSVVFNGLFRLALGVRCRDINAMPKVLRRDLYEQLGITSTDWFIDTEMMVKAEAAGLRILEMPIEYLKRMGGASVVRASTVWEFLNNARRAITSGRLAEWKRVRCVGLDPAQAGARAHG